MGGEAGDGVHFIEYNFVSRGQKQVHPGEAPAVQRPVDGLGRVLDPLGGLMVDPGGAVDLGGLQCIFFLLIEKAVGKLDFIYRAYGEHIAAKYGAAHLEPVDGLFNDDPVVVQKRQLHRGVQF